MIRVLLAGALLTAVVSTACAADPVVRLSVAPMAEPKPALRYQLLPEVRELTPGNPVQWYIRCFQEQRFFFFSKEAAAERARYRTMPLAELPARNLRDYGRSALTQADWGARLDTPDWQVLQRVQAEGADLRLTELGPLRVLGEALQVRFRGAVAGRRYDDAVASCKTMLALARHLGECPVGEANRVGISVAERAFDTLEEMLQQPGCPNLYWALADLPRPLVELRKGMQGDALRAAGALGRLRDEVMTAEELEEVISSLSAAIGTAREQQGRPPRSLRAFLREGAKDAAMLRAARVRRAGVGLVQLLFDRLPPAQLLLLDQKHAFETLRDERLKLLALEPWQMGRPAVGEPDCLLADLLPDVRSARLAQARLQRRVALLRCVEALRMYAAAQEGKLPEKLRDCPVPIPDDPFTGKPFRYESIGATAHLRGDSADGLHYQVVIRK